MTAQAHPSTSSSAASPWAPFGLVALVTLALHLGAPTNHDVAWVLEGAGRMLDGARFGRDIVDVNPPLVWWLATVPVLFARVTGGSVAGAATVFPIMVAMASGVLANAVLSRGKSAIANRAGLTLLATAFLLIAPGYDYGQREHVMLIATLPYLTAVSVRADGHSLSRPLAMAAGVVSAIGFCLKPYFLLIPLVVELWLAVTMRGIRPCVRTETVAMAAAVLVYVASVLAFAPDYIFSVVPGAAAGYWAYNASLPTVVANLVFAVFPALLVATILCRYLRPGAMPAAAQVAFLASAGAVLAALVQMKGWSYQLLPATGFAFMGCAVLYTALEAPARRRPLAAAAIMLLVFVSFEHSASYAWQSVSGQGTVGRVERLAAVFRAHAGPGGSVFAFITSPRDIHPAVLASGARWVAPSCCLHQLPAGLRADELAPDRAARARAGAQQQLDATISLIAEEKPRVIVIDANPNKLGFAGASFDYLGFLLHDVRFATLWKAYSERTPVDGFRIFVRSP